jgi:hypothetical protein
MMIPGTSKIPVWFATLIFVITIACAQTDTTAPGPGDSAVKGEDQVPPQKIADPRLAYPVHGGSAVLTWTAPRDDDAHNTVHRYEIQHAYSSPLDWDASLPVDDPPVPIAEGQSQSYLFTDPARGRDLYAAIRSFDEAGNASPVSDVTHVHIAGLSLEGRCTEAMSGQSIAGLDVEVTERRVHQLDSDDHGQYSLNDVASGVTNVLLRSGASTPTYHDYRLAIDLSDDASLEHLMIEYQPAENPVVDNILILLLQAAGIPGERPRLRKWPSYPIAVYVPAFVNQHTIDYEDYCKRAVQHWNDRTGLHLFTLVGAPPDDGMTMRFKTRSEMGGIHIGLTRWEEDEDGYPTRAYVDIIDEFPDPDRLRQVALHELGHTIRLEHLPSGYLMYQSHPLPDSPTNDEVLMVQLYMALPNDYDLAVYDLFEPR